MIILKKLEDLNNIKFKDTAVAVGMFDSFHIGHLEIIKKLKSSNLKSCVFSFDIDNNFELLKKKNKIISSQAKQDILRNLYIDYYFSPDFNKIKYIPARDFVVDLLINKLKSKLIICGEDFRFGFGRSGDIELLKNISQEFNIKINIIKTKLINNKKISSSDIRKYISDGNISLANQLLGRNFSLDFKIIKYKNNFLYQELDNKFVTPPNGKYLSIIKQENQIIKTFTIIDNIIKFKPKIAKTFMDFDFYKNNKHKKNNIKIELINKIN